MLNSKGVLKKFWIRMCGEILLTTRQQKPTDEQNLQPIFKLNFLFHPEINKLNHFLQPILILKVKMKKVLDI